MIFQKFLTFHVNFTCNGPQTIWMIAVTSVTNENKLIIDKFTADDALVMFANFIVNWQSTVLVLVLIFHLTTLGPDGVQVTSFSPKRIQNQQLLGGETKKPAS